MGQKPKSSQSFPIPLARYAGTYHSTPYGNITVCPLPHLPQSKECTELYLDFASIGSSPVPALFAYFQQQPIWAKYLTIVPTSDGGDFVVNATTIFPMAMG
jgi:hypothetical protein